MTVSDNTALNEAISRLLRKLKTEDIAVRDLTNLQRIYLLATYHLANPYDRQQLNYAKTKLGRCKPRHPLLYLHASKGAPGIPSK